MIFMKLRSRSSRATGPKMRVPRGLFAVASRTAALSSKRIRTLVLLGHTHHHGLDDLTLLDLTAGLSRLDGRGNGVADRRVLAVVPAGHADAQDLFRS